MEQFSSFWAGRSVLVTGASGLTGMWLVPALARRGVRVHALLREGSSRNRIAQANWPNEIHLVWGDVTDCESMCRTMETCRVQTVFHLAGQTSVGASRQEPTKTLDANVRGVWNTLEAARLSSRPEVILASSSQAGNDAAGGSPYSTSKACAEMIAALYRSQYDLRIAIVRFGNLFGGGDTNLTRSVPGMIAAALRGESFVMRSNGQSEREYAYVEDAVVSLIRCAEQLASGVHPVGGFVDAGRGYCTSVLRLNETVLRIAGRSDLRPVILGSEVDPPETPHRIGSNALAQSEFEGALRKSFQWYREHLALVDSLRLDRTASATT